MGQVEVFQRHGADEILIRHLHLVLIVLGGDFSGFRVHTGARAGPGLGAVADFHLHGLGQGVLPVKQIGKEAPHLGERPFPLIVSGQQGDQHIGVVDDLVQVIVVFVITGMQRFVVVQLILQIRLQLRISCLRAQHILIPRGIGGGGQGGGGALKEHGTGGQGV